jgi:restriction endonuclease S subunit
MISPYLKSALSGKSNKIDLNILLGIEMSIPSLSSQTKIVEFFDVNYAAINQMKKQIKTIELLKNQYIESICDNYPMIKIKELCDVDIKPNCNLECNNNDSHVLCVQRNSKSAGNTFYYDNNKNVINNNVYYINNIKDYNTSALYILLKHNEANLNKLASITSTINLSRTNLENFEIKKLPINIQETMINSIYQYDYIIKTLLTSIEHLLNINIFI